MVAWLGNMKVVVRVGMMVGMLELKVVQLVVKKAENLDL